MKKKNKCKECQAWHDDALDWRESEIAKAVKAERERIINWDEIVPLIESEIQVRLEQATSKPLPDKCPECGSEVNIRDCGNHYWWMCPTCGARMMDKYSPSSDKVREILIRHFEPVDVDEKVDFAYSLTTCVNEICGGKEWIKHR